MKTKIEEKQDEIISASAILQCHVGFGNDLDGFFDVTTKAMEEYALQFKNKPVFVTDEEIYTYAKENCKNSDKWETEFELQLRAMQWMKDRISK